MGKRFEHVRRMNNDGITRKIYMKNVKYKRVIEWPKKTWLDEYCLKTKEERYNERE